MNKLGQGKTKWLITCVMAVLLTACVSNGQYDNKDGEIVLPDKVIEQADPPVSKPSRRLGPEPTPGFKRKMLAAVNAARVGGYTCGNRRMPAVDPVVWNEQLQQSAFAHSKNMADGDYFNHRDKQGNRVGERTYAAGYNWRAAGENIAAGQLEARVVMTGWLGSKGHCLNIMDGDYTEMGMASYTNNSSYYSIYWTQVLAAPF
ncbi:CAP domain-containing protein [Moritella marina ATCC 15381]|uniref:CAP domain-containing protein n=1 Tax=Moritella marina ATCC 15381 TaxID=1202962 RepID=A0A5J6WK87_MORMI|nr:CAP domain-containing protein [Moritella marina]QFI37255.1 CAP domain-containing protein [Moritella marina ATCC 15381]